MEKTLFTLLLVLERRDKAIEVYIACIQVK